MKIRDHIYDVESYPNVFTLSAEDAHSGQQWVFEISFRRNDMLQLVEWVLSGARMVGFNSMHFDYPLLHWIMENYRHGITPEAIYNEAQKLINTPFEQRFRHRVWDDKMHAPQLDLMMVHHFDNKARFTSLKILEFNMRRRNVQDLPYTPGTYLDSNQIDNLIRYNLHEDVGATKEFYHLSTDLIRFREELTEKYGRNFVNHNDTKIGKDYFLMELERLIPGCTKDPLTKKKRQTVRDHINLGSVIFPYIRFEQPEFQRIRDYLASKVITETKGVFKGLSATVEGFQYDFGVGGIHGSIEAETVASDAENVLIDLDVASYYPNLAIANRLYPAHLGTEFCDIYQDVYQQRKGYKKGTAENAMLKLALNGVYGDSNNKHSSFYDPAYTMGITINGQLLLCILAEQLIKIPGLRMIQINTDGLTVLCPRGSVQQLQTIRKWWEDFTLLELEDVEYSRMFIRDVNNYIGEYTDGKLKRKGAYEYVLDSQGGTMAWYQNHSALVVAKAAEAALVRGENVREFILNHDDAMDFMLRTKVPRSSRLELGGEQVQNVTRYVVSHGGGELTKVMPPTPKQRQENPDAPARRIGIQVGWTVTECNNLDRFDPRCINHQWYIEEANKLVDPLC